MSKIIIDEKIFENYPSFQVGVVVLRGINNQESIAEVGQLLRQTEAGLRQQFEAEGINQHPEVLAWREAHKKFGSDPKRYMPSVWAVTKRVVKGGDLPLINTLVDLYNHISIKYIITVGGEDLDCCQGDIQLTYARGHEAFRTIGEEVENPPAVGEVIYKDDLGVLCRKFNWREADRTKLTKETKNAIIEMEALPPVDQEVLAQALEEFSKLVEKYCGGQGRFFILNKDNLEAVL